MSKILKVNRVKWNYTDDNNAEVLKATNSIKEYSDAEVLKATNTIKEYCAENYNKIMGVVGKPIESTDDPNGNLDELLNEVEKLYKETGVGTTSDRPPVNPDNDIKDVFFHKNEKVISEKDLKDLKKVREIKVSKFNDNVFRPSNKREDQPTPSPCFGGFAKGFSDEELKFLDPEYELNSLEQEFFNCKSKVFKAIRDLKKLEDKIHKKYQEMYPDMSIEDIKAKFNY